MENLEKVIKRIEDARHQGNPIYLVDFNQEIKGEDDSYQVIKRWMIQGDMEDGDSGIWDADANLAKDIQKMLGLEEGVISFRLEDNHGNWASFQFSDYHIWMVKMIWAT